MMKKKEEEGWDGMGMGMGQGRAKEGEEGLRQEHYITGRTFHSHQRHMQHTDTSQLHHHDSYIHIYIDNMASVTSMSLCRQSPDSTMFQAGCLEA
ncbi:hypothetical protein TWF506_009816 [Arthrobotrys conoides]|uniref:Uncharacterized protein n=1 Tax=Arthrobotrys conoides TaxID=74498 RepID=A0AAN8PD22_9PEZI